MKLFVISRQGNVVQNQAHTMVIAARNADEAEHLARTWKSEQKKSLADAKLSITEVELTRPQIILIQSL